METFGSFMLGVLLMTAIALFLGKQKTDSWGSYLRDRAGDIVAAALIAIVIGCAAAAGVLDRVLAYLGISLTEKWGDVPITKPAVVVAGVACDLLARITIIPILRAKLAPKEN